MTDLTDGTDRVGSRDPLNLKSHDIDIEDVTKRAPDK